MRDGKAALQWVSGHASNGVCILEECAPMVSGMDEVYPLYYDKPENHKASRAPCETQTVDIPRSSRGAAAAATWIDRGRVAAPPRLPRGYSVEAARGDAAGAAIVAAATTWNVARASPIDALIETCHHRHASPTIHVDSRASVVPSGRYAPKPRRRRRSITAAKAYHAYKPNKWPTDEDDPTNQHKVTRLFFGRLYLFLKKKMDDIGCAEQFAWMIQNPGKFRDSPGLK